MNLDIMKSYLVLREPQVSRIEISARSELEGGRGGYTIKPMLLSLDFIFNCYCLLHLYLLIYLGKNFVS